MMTRNGARFCQNQPISTLFFSAHYLLFRRSSKSGAETALPVEIEGNSKFKNQKRNKEQLFKPVVCRRSQERTPVLSWEASQFMACYSRPMQPRTFDEFHVSDYELFIIVDIEHPDKIDDR